MRRKNHFTSICSGITKKEQSWFEKIRINYNNSWHICMPSMRGVKVKGDIKLEDIKHELRVGPMWLQTNSENILKICGYYLKLLFKSSKNSHK